MFSTSSALSQKAADGAKMVEALRTKKFFSADEESVLQILADTDQMHLFAHWEDGKNDDLKHAFLKEVIAVNKFCPLQDYVKRARSLLKDAKHGVNPYEGFVASVPQGQTLETRTDAGRKKFDEFEKTGIEKEMSGATFVLVAGGLGERLEYPGIKVALPIETTTMQSYLHYYVTKILAFQEAARISSGDKALLLPLVIMTSGDTDTLTRKLLDDHKNFGMEKDQIGIVLQEKVPSLSDNEGHFVLESSMYSLNTKPHGHGDVHMLLWRSGWATKWVQEKRKWVVFFQDTNGLVFHAVPAALGVSSSMNMAVNSLTVPRKPGEAVGAIMCLEKKGETKEKDLALTINVEYNQLETLVKKEPLDKDGFSVYPGNINVLIMALAPYAENLKKTGGIIGEFVNPKYADSSKTVFKKDTRLECMMQDYPKLLLGTNAVVGFTQMERFLAFSPVKNSLKEAAAKQAAKLAPECASSGEADFYRATRLLLKERAGFAIDVDGKTETFAQISTDVGARCVLSPYLYTTQSSLSASFPGGSAVKISNTSTLIIDARSIVVKSLTLDGALVIRAAPGAIVTVDGLTVKNKGWSFKALSASDKVDPKIAIRGYDVQKTEVTLVEFKAAGTYTLSDSTVAKYAASS